MIRAAPLLPFLLLAALPPGCLEACGDPVAAQAALSNETGTAIDVRVEVLRDGRAVDRLDRSVAPGATLDAALGLPEGSYEADVTVPGHPPARQAFDVQCGGGGFAVAVTPSGVHTSELVVD